MSNFIIEKNKESVEIRFTDNLVSNSVEILRNTLKKLLSENVPEIIMNFRDIDMIDSMGIGLLVSTHNTLSARDSHLILINLSADLLELFTVMRLNEFFTIRGE